MSKEQLNSTQVLSASVDQGSFCTTHGVRTVGSNVQTDFCNPRINDSCVLPSREVVRVVDPAWKQIGVGLKLSLLDPSGNGISRRRGDFKLDRALRLLLKHDGARGNVIRRTDIAHPQLDQVTRPQLAVDRQIEQCKIPNFLCQLKVDTNRPDVAKSKRGLLPVSLPLFQGSRRWMDVLIVFIADSYRGGGAC